MEKHGEKSWNLLGSDGSVGLLHEVEEYERVF